MNRLAWRGSWIGFVFMALPPMAHTEDPANGFEKLKNLAGEWEAELDGGHLVRSSYRLISNGTAVIESINDATHEDMVTIYHPDGGELRAVHYCSSANQPRLDAVWEGETLAFSMVDVTNLTEPGQRHIRRITFRFEDRDHYMQEWTQRENGEDSVDTLRFVRKK
ncbi:MAG: hypothetical protein EPO25_09435 [Gammaproteobacteria bacterium]|nr:MAG: hypothetical protein EPO25_09435 [Gammaproteobacteria bacterium]